MAISSVVPPELIERLSKGEIRAASRLISLAEGEPDGARAALRRLPFPESTHVVGVTGAPGVGKSTLLNGLIRQARDERLTVGVLAVDPTSPFSGGAVLGDRLRMQEHAADPDVFVRSMASRTGTGGLSHATHDAIRILAALGKDIIFLETVGAGQLETEVIHYADSVCVLVVPGAGDSVQAIKGGLMEIADLFIVNMADRPDSLRMVKHLEGMLHDGPATEWKVPVLRAVAKQGEGISEIWHRLRAHHAHLVGAGELGLRRRRWMTLDLRARACNALRRALDEVDAAALVQGVQEGTLDFDQAVRTMIEQALARLNETKGRTNDE